jgi:hypothetical protein
VLANQERHSDNEASAQIADPQAWIDESVELAEQCACGAGEFRTRRRSSDTRLRDERSQHRARKLRWRQRGSLTFSIAPSSDTFAHKRLRFVTEAPYDAAVLSDLVATRPHLDDLASKDRPIFDLDGARR